MVLWRVKGHEQLELLRNLAVEGAPARCRPPRAVPRTQPAARGGSGASGVRRGGRGSGVTLSPPRSTSRVPSLQVRLCRAAATLRARLEAERRVLAAFAELTPQDAEVVFEPSSAALAEYDGLGDEFKAAHAELHSAKTMIDGVARRFEARAASG